MNIVQVPLEGQQPQKEPRMLLRSQQLMICILGMLASAMAVGEAQENVPGPLRVAINAGPEGDAVKQLATGYRNGVIELVELPYQSLREQLITRLGDKEPDFDVIMVDDPWFPQLASKLKILTDVPQPLLEDIVSASLSLGRYPYEKGDLRALPFVGNTQVLFYRTDLLEKLGIRSVPRTWKDLAALAKEITTSSEQKVGANIYGYAIRGRSGAPIVTDFLPIYWSLGGKLVDDGGSPRAEAIDGEKLREALHIYKVLQLASPPGATNFDWSEMTAAFTNGQAIFQLNWASRYSYYR